MTRHVTHKRNHPHPYRNAAGSIAHHALRAMPYGKLISHGINLFGHAANHVGKWVSGASSTAHHPRHQNERGVSNVPHARHGMELTKAYAGADAVTYSHFNWTARHRKQRFSHNKFTCSEGTVFYHKEDRIESEVANTAWVFREVMNGANWDKFSKTLPFSYSTGGATINNAKRQVILNNSGLVRASNDNDALTYESTNEQSNVHPQVRVEWYKHQHRVINRNNHPVWIDIWDIVLKESAITTGVVDPINILNVAYPQNEAGANTFFYGSTGQGGIAGASNLTYIHPDFKIHVAKQFSDAWTRKKHTRVRLMPGEQHIHSVFVKSNFVYDPNYLDATLGCTNIGGITQGTLIRATGDIVHANITGTNSKPTIDGTLIDYMETYRVKLSQVDPWRDHFDLIISPPYTNAGMDRTSVARMELEVPTEEVGLQE